MGTLLVVGAVLTLADAVLVGVLVFSTPPPWLWAMLAISPWGPIALGFGFFIGRYRRKVRLFRDAGLAGRATVESIRSTGSVINGRAVLRLELSVALADRPPYPASVRTAPPYHLAGMLRPGVQLPVKADPGKPERIMVDWPQAERETSPARQPGLGS